MIKLNPIIKCHCDEYRLVIFFVDNDREVICSLSLGICDTLLKADLAEDILITAPAIEAGKATKPTFSFVMKSTGSSVTSGKFNVPADKITLAEGESKDVVITAKDANFTGEARAITLTEKDLENILTLNNKALVAGEDFEIDETSYLKNVKKVTATFVVKGIGDSGGVKTLKFKIVQKTIKWNGSYVDGKFTK